MTAFRPGDKLRCVEPFGPLEAGRVYTVAHCTSSNLDHNGPHVYLEEVEEGRFGFRAQRFEAVKDVPEADPVSAPHHYNRWKIEPVTFIMENDLPFWMGNVIKYVMRSDAKNGVEDLKKAIRYITFEINRLEGGPIVQP